MRREPTRAEDKLWQALRRTPLPFRRQAAFGPYVVDFVCHRARLIVEVDGAVHLLEAVAARDAVREAWLRVRGYDVIRFSNDDVMTDISGTVERILVRCGVDTPTPNPSPQGGGGL